MKVLRSQLEKIFNVGARQISEYQKQGMPYISNPAGNEYELELVVPWRIEYEKSKARSKPESKNESEVRLRKLTAEAGREELKLEIESKEVAPIAMLEREFTGLIYELKARSLQMPQRIAPILLGLRTEIEIKNVIDKEVRETFNSFGNYKEYEHLEK